MTFIVLEIGVSISVFFALNSAARALEGTNGSHICFCRTLIILSSPLLTRSLQVIPAFPTLSKFYQRNSCSSEHNS